MTRVYDTILFYQGKQYSRVILAISNGAPGFNVSFLNNRLPASKIKTSKPSDLNSAIIVAFRARPPKGFFFQPQGSVSPFTLAVLTIRICVSEKTFAQIL